MCITTTHGEHREAPTVTCCAHMLSWHLCDRSVSPTSLIELCRDGLKVNTTSSSKCGPCLPARCRLCRYKLFRALRCKLTCRWARALPRWTAAGWGTMDAALLSYIDNNYSIMAGRMSVQIICTVLLYRTVGGRFHRVGRQMWHQYPPES